MAGRVVSSKATKFYTYSRTARSNTEYATKMKRLSNQIFGEVSEEFGLVIFSNNALGETPHEWFTSCPRPKVCQWAFGAEWSLGMLLFFSSALSMIIMLSIQITWYPGLEETAELMRNLRDYGLFRQDAIHLVYHVKTEIISWEFY